MARIFVLETTLNCKLHDCQNINWKIVWKCKKKKTTQDGPLWYTALYDFVF